jgi:hypothetical protein
MNYESLNLKEYFGDKFPYFLEKCLRIKSGNDRVDNLVDYYQEALVYFLRLGYFVLKSNEINILNKEPEILNAFEKYSSVVFRDLNIKQKIYESIVALGYFRKSRFNWVITSKFGKIVNLLYCMHLSSLSYFNGNADKQGFLNEAAKITRELTCFEMKSEKSNDFVEKWVLLRGDIAEIFKIFFRSIRNNKSHVDFILDQ